MSGQRHTPGPWEYVPSTEHHGPYITSEFGNTVADCYVMSKPGMLSRRNGGESEPIHHLGEMADANARLIAAAPDLLDALLAAKEMADVMEGLSSGRSDDEWIWAAQAKINGAITKAVWGQK